MTTQTLPRWLRRSSLNDPLESAAPVISGTWAIRGHSGVLAMYGIVIDGRFVALDQETLECLRYEAAESGISIAQAYREEMAAREELERITPPMNVLLGWGRQANESAANR